MARVGCAIVMRTPFRSSTQEFSNVFHYESLGPMGPGDADGLIDYLVNRIKPYCSPGVTFLRGSVWSTGGTQAQNQMIHEKALTGTGTGATADHIDKERAVLIQWPAGVDSRGHPVTLKKWFHPCGIPTGASFANAVLANVAPIDPGVRTQLETLAAGFRDVNTLTEPFELCSKTGRKAQGGPVCHQYLEHHQLGDAWRGT